MIKFNKLLLFSFIFVCCNTSVKSKYMLSKDDGIEGFIKSEDLDKLVSETKSTDDNENNKKNIDWINVEVEASVEKTNCENTDNTDNKSGVHEPVKLEDNDPKDENNLEWVHLTNPNDATVQKNNSTKNLKKSNLTSFGILSAGALLLSSIYNYFLPSKKTEIQKNCTIDEYLAPEAYLNIKVPKSISRGAVFIFSNNPDNRSIALRSKNRISIYNIQNKNFENLIFNDQYLDTIYDISFSKTDKNLILTRNNGSLELYNLYGKNCTKDECPTKLTYDDISQTSTIWNYDDSDGKYKKESTISEEHFPPVKYYPTQKIYIYQNLYEDFYEVYNKTTGKQIKRFPSSSYFIFVPENNKFISGGRLDDIIEIRNNNFDLINKIYCRWWCEIYYVKDSKIFVAKNHRGEALIYDADSHKLLKTLKTDSRVRYVQYSPDGSILGILYSDNTLKLFKINKNCTI